MTTNKLCPSSPMEKGALLMGLVNAQGQIDYLGTPIPINKKFIKIAFEGRSPGKRFRFANKCTESGCARWKKGGCSVAEHASTIAIKSSKSTPNCGIRKACRWFSQEGVVACNICPMVITDASPS